MNRKRGRDVTFLTYRGEEKALTLMKQFDHNHDGKLDFPDFRGYLRAFNR